MADPNQGQEPSMEDILASIRRIIDEDDRKAGGPSPAPSDEPEAPDDEVLDLTEFVEEEQEDRGDEAGASGIQTDEGADDSWDVAPEPADLPEETVAMAATTDVEISPPVSPARHAAEEEAMTPSSHERLVSDAALSSAAAALGSLARASERDPLQGVPKGRPVEDLVMELLKPMLREWLDQNLPTIVERIVEREVRYLSRRLEADGRD